MTWYIYIYRYIIYIIMSRYQRGYPDPLSQLSPIVHCFQHVFKTISRIDIELLFAGSSWSCCLCWFMWRCPQEYITYELVRTSPAVTHMSGSCKFDSSRDQWCVAVQLLLCRVLPPGLLQYCSSVVTVKLFLHRLSIYIYIYIYICMWNILLI